MTTIIEQIPQILGILGMIAAMISYQCKKTNSILFFRAFRVHFSLLSLF